MAKSFGRYELLRELGRGGQAAVYEAEDTELGRRVALKVLLRGARSEEGVARLMREARAAARLDHPNIVAVYDVGEWRGRPYLAMELVGGDPPLGGDPPREGGPARGGESLQEAIDRRAVSVREALCVTYLVARAAHHAHGHGVIHRDIKPANILLERNGTPRLADFGFARDAADREKLTQTGTTLGTPLYMSPEQAKGGSDEADARSDVYAMGAVFYAMLAGRPPFEATNLLELLDKVAHETPRPPSAFREGLPREVETICLKCLEKDPARRYRTADALAEDCRRFLEREAIAARPAGVVHRARSLAGRHRAVAAVLLLTLVAASAVEVRTRAAIRSEKDAAGLALAELRSGREALEALGRSAGSLRREIDRMEDDLPRLRAEALRPGGKARPGSPAAGPEAGRSPGDGAAGKDATGPDDVDDVDHVDAPPVEPPAAPAVPAVPSGRRIPAPGVPAVPPVGESAGAAARAVDAVDVDVDALLDEFASLVAKGEYAAARRRAEEGAAKTGSDVLRAAARLARLLEERPAAIRRGAESMVGKDVRLRTRTGTVPGKLRDVTDRHLLVVVTYTINRRQGRKPVKVAWSSLHPEQVDGLARAGGLEVPPADRAVAKCCAAMAAGDLDTAEAALAEAPGHPLAARLLKQIALARADAAYSAAMGRARARLGLRNWKGAVESLEEALGAKPDDAEAKKLLARAGAAYTRLRGAEEVARKNKSKDWDQDYYDRKIKEANRGLREDPGNAYEYYMDRAYGHKKKGMYAEALADETRAIESDPRNPRAYNSRASTYWDLGDFGNAVADMTKVIELKDGSYFHDYFRRGRMYYEKGDFGSAIEDFSAAIERHATYAASYKNRGLCHQRMGDHRKALADFNKTIELDPDECAAYKRRAELFAEMGKLGLALADYNAWAPGACCYRHKYGPRGRFYLYYLRNSEKAITDFRNWIKLEPDDIFGAIWLHFALCMNGQDGVAELRSLAGGLDKEKWPYPAVRLYLGEIQPDEFLAAIGGDTKEEKLGRTCEALFFVGKHYALRHDREKAREYFEKCIATGVHYYVEFHAAKLELRLLERDASPAAGSRPAGSPPPADADTPGRAVPTKEEEPAAPRTIEAPCPGCKGTGLIRETGCRVCEAHGYDDGAWCVVCERSGRAEYKCSGCGGLGEVDLMRKRLTCRSCGGRGAPACAGCKGTGKIRRPNPAAAGGPTVTCWACSGDGLERTVKCRKCTGSGLWGTAKCHYCGGIGTGRPVCPRCDGKGYTTGGKRTFPCATCCGTGHLFQPCRTCGGAGWRRSK